MILETQTRLQAIGEARAAREARKGEERRRRREEAQEARREAGRLGERDALAQGTLALPGTTGSLFAPVQRRTA